MNLAHVESQLRDAVQTMKRNHVKPCADVDRREGYAVAVDTVMFMAILQIADIFDVLSPAVLNVYDDVRRTTIRRHAFYHRGMETFIMVPLMANAR